MVTIDRVDKRSLADRLGLRAGDRLVSLNGYEINDVLDYEFYAADSGLRIEYERGGVRRAVSVWHPAGGDLGLHFFDLPDGRKAALPQRLHLLLHRPEPEGTARKPVL